MNRLHNELSGPRFGKILNWWKLKGVDINVKTVKRRTSVYRQILRYCGNTEDLSNKGVLKSEYKKKS